MFQLVSININLPLVSNKMHVNVASNAEQSTFTAEHCSLTGDGVGKKIHNYGNERCVLVIFTYAGLSSLSGADGLSKVVLYHIPNMYC